MRERERGRFHPMLAAVSMAASELEVAVFIDTDFGTRLAVAVPPDITAGALKREVERVHSNCFPSIGEIKVDGFMVKQNSNFYHLPDTVLRKLTSQVDGVQFLHVKARPMNEFNEPHSPENAGCFPNLSNPACSLERTGCSRRACTSKISVDCKKRKRKRLRTKDCLTRLARKSIFARNTRRKMKRSNKNQLLEDMEKNSDIRVTEHRNGDDSIDTTLYHCVPKDEAGTRKQRYASCSLIEATSELSSEVMSVSSIINRYFPSYDEVSSISNRSSRDVPQMKNMERRGPRLLSLPLNGGSQKPERSNLGRRLVMASYSLGISPSRERAEISLCNSKGKRFQEIMSLAKTSCFEISDSED